MKKLFGRTPSQKGFTIVEIVIVIALILLVIVPLARVIASSLEASNEQQYLTHCAFLAQLKLEEVRTRANCYTNGGADCPPSFTQDWGFEEVFTQNPPCDFPFPFTKYECTVEYVSSTRSPLMDGDIKTIQVRVWYDKNNDDTFDPAEGEPDIFLETQLAERAPVFDVD